MSFSSKPKTQQERDSITSSADLPPECDEIQPYLFLGNLAFARNEEQVAANKITHILNLTRHTLPKGVLRRCVYTSIILKDKSGQDIISHFMAAFGIIESAKKHENGRIFLHCKAGVSRSVTIAIAYLMHAYKWTLKKAWFYVRQRRPVIHPNRGFLAQLVEFERRLYPQLKTSTLSLHDDVLFTVFERMEELHGAPLMDFCREKPFTQYEVAKRASQAYSQVYGKRNDEHCYDAGIGGKMHLHCVEVYQRKDTAWLDKVIEGYLIELRNAQSTVNTAASGSGGGHGGGTGDAQAIKK